MNQQKLSQTHLSYSEWLDAFQERWKAKHLPPDTFIEGFHPKSTGIGKKDTAFYRGCCHVRFDRKTLPKGGKSVINGCFIERKAYGWLIWCKTTRALLRLTKQEPTEQLINETKETLKWQQKTE